MEAFFLVLNCVQLAVFPAKTKVNRQSNQQPDRKINPVPHTQLGHHIQAAHQSEQRNQRQVFFDRPNGQAGEDDQENPHRNFMFKKAEATFVF